MGTFGYILYAIVVAAAVLFYFKVAKEKNLYRSKKKANEYVQKILDEYGLTFSGMTTFFCKYVGGHPERDRESSINNSLYFWVKNGKLIFFEGVGIHFKDGLLSPVVEGSLTPDKVFIDSTANLTYLFDIPIDNIEDIRYFDATTSSTMAIVGGDSWAIPIRMKKGDASVLIDWKDGKYSHSTEFRFVGLVAGTNANRKANTMRNTLIKMTK